MIFPGVFFLWKIQWHILKSTDIRDAASSAISLSRMSALAKQSLSKLRTHGSLESTLFLYILLTVQTPLETVQKLFSLKFSTPTPPPKKTTKINIYIYIVLLFGENSQAVAYSAQPLCGDWLRNLFPQHSQGSSTEIAEIP